MAEAGGTYFLDTSALIKLYHEEQGTQVVERWAADQTSQIWISDLARVELHSVLLRKLREAELTEGNLQTVLECFTEDLRNRFKVVPPMGDTLERAISLLLDHGKKLSLRTLDALQIASAQDVDDQNLTFVTADTRLFSVASALFPRVINPEVDE